MSAVAANELVLVSGKELQGYRPLAPTLPALVEGAVLLGRIRSFVSSLTTNEYRLAMYLRESLPTRHMKSRLPMKFWKVLWI